MASPIRFDGDPKKADPINEISKKYQFEPLNQAKLANEYQALIAAYKKADI